MKKVKKDAEGQPPQPTRSLKQFDVLLGEWMMVGIHPYLPVAVHGGRSFERLREAALQVWHFDWDPGQGRIPSALSIIGHDGAVDPCSMLYTDERALPVSIR